MIKTIVSLSILISLILIITYTFPETVNIILQIKWIFLIYVAWLFSRLAIFLLMWEIAFEVISKFLRKL